ncbi:MAG: response regulator [Sulfurimonas sp.]|nr:response regulator [Sulfurimonas sp.]
MISIEELKELAQNYTVLYVEDDEELRNGVVHYLRNFFKEVKSAVNGEEGLLLYKESMYDIVITDIGMPKMNGLEMALKMREINARQEILIVSAYSESSLIMDSIEIGVSGYIVKPIDFRKINDVLYKVLYKLEAFKENELYKTNLEKLVELGVQEQRQNYEKTILSLVSMIEKRDTYTGGHSQRVANYSKLIAAEMGYDEEKCNLVYRAGILHDIGKITTPDSILLKPGKLSNLEYHIIQEHVQMSSEILAQIPMYKEFIDIILAHHEHYDGSGYPNALKGDAIPELAQIMIVADAFDAMTTSRIYKARKSIDTAIQELQTLSGTHFSPLVVENAVKVLSHVNVSKEISQLPESELEQERFAYFYKDQVTDLHNATYLDLILLKNIDSQKYTNISIIFLHNFSHYNANHGWIFGDKFLNQFANLLKARYPKELLFRINGSDFVVVKTEACTIDINEFAAKDPLLGS